MIDHGRCCATEYEARLCSYIVPEQFQCGSCLACIIVPGRSERVLFQMRTFLIGLSVPEDTAGKMMVRKSCNPLAKV